MQTGDKVKFVSCSLTSFEALQEKDGSTIYFVSSASGNSIYVGNIKFCANSGLEAVVAGLINGDNLSYGAS